MTQERKAVGVGAVTEVGRLYGVTVPLENAVAS